EDLVGQGVEEGAGAGGAVPAGQVPVDAVGDAQDDPEPDRRPGGTVGQDHDQERHREDEPGHREEVGRGGEGRRPELGGHRAATSTGVPERSNPSAPVTRTGTMLPTARSSGTTTIPSISGASRWLRATPGASTSTSRTSPTSASRRAAVMRSWSSVSSARRSAMSPAGTWPSRSAA